MSSAYKVSHVTAQMSGHISSWSGPEHKWGTGHVEGSTPGWGTGHVQGSTSGWGTGHVQECTSGCLEVAVLSCTSAVRHQLALSSAPDPAATPSPLHRSAVESGLFLGLFFKLQEAWSALLSASVSMVCCINPVPTRILLRHLWATPSHNHYFTVVQCLD